MEPAVELVIDRPFAAAVWALTLQHTHPRIATDVHYVAGDRVVSDPLCKPFSMGRNLFCVHSKKHMDDDPNMKAAKSKTNRQTLITLSRELNKVKARALSYKVLQSLKWKHRSLPWILDCFHALTGTAKPVTIVSTNR